MVAIFLSPLYILVYVYLILRMIRWMRTFYPGKKHRVLETIVIVIAAVLALLPLAGIILPDSLKSYGKLANNRWFGSFVYLIIFIVIFEIVHLIICLIKHRSIRIYNEKVFKICGAVIIAAVVGISIYGSIHAIDVKKTDYDVVIKKETSVENMTIALVADLHLGANSGVGQVELMKKIIDDMQPDLIVYAGDVFDNDYDDIVNPEKIIEILAGLDSTYGSYACWGNHDIDEVILAGFTFSSKDEKITSDPRMDDFLERAGVELLKDEAVLVDDSFYLVGRLDASCYKKSGTVRKTPDELTETLDMTKPVIIIDHQPAELNELSEAGADLVLSGHTHDGQIFPGNLTCAMAWDNSYGMMQVGDMTDIVTSGVGFWGPAMRVGTISEVVQVNVKFGSSDSGSSR